MNEKKNRKGNAGNRRWKKKLKERGNRKIIKKEGKQRKEQKRCERKKLKDRKQ